MNATEDAVLKHDIRLHANTYQHDRCYKSSNKHEIEIKKQVNKVEMEWFSAIQIWSMRCEYIVIHYVEWGHHQTSKVRGVYFHHGQL